MMKRIRVAFVVPTLDKGGAERVLVNLINQFDRSAIEPVIFCLEKKGSLLGNVADDVRIVDVRSPRLYFSIFRLRKEYKKHKPDLVVGWMGHINAYLAFCSPFFLRNVKLLCRESSIPSQFISHYRFPGLFRYLYKFYNRFSTIICQSVAMKDDLVQSFKVKPERIKVIHNPVLTNQTGDELPETVQAFLKQGDKILLFVGRFSKEKQVHLCVEVMKFLPASYKLVLLGYGKEEHSLKKLISQNNLSKRVLIVTGVSRPASYYKMADCTLLTSAFEGFPNVLLEANAEGCPLVVYKTAGGAKEVVNEENGIYIEPVAVNDIQTFARSIIAVCEAHGKYDRTLIKKITNEKYNIETITRQYEQLILGVINDR